MAEAASCALETKLNQLKRHKDSLHAIRAAVEKSKQKEEELKIASGEKIATIKEWGDKVDEELTAVDKDMDSMAKYLSEMGQEQVEKSRREQLAFKKELFEQKLEFNQGWKVNRCHTQIKTQVTWKAKSKVQ